MTRARHGRLGCRTIAQCCPPGPAASRVADHAGDPWDHDDDALPGRSAVPGRGGRTARRTVPADRPGRRVRAGAAACSRARWGSSPNTSRVSVRDVRPAAGAGGTAFQRTVWRALADDPVRRDLQLRRSRACGRPAVGEPRGRRRERQEPDRDHRAVSPRDRREPASSPATAAGLPTKRWLLAHERGCVQPSLPGVGDRPAAACPG